MSEKNATLTPMMEQYHQLKSAHPNALLFFRMGDFYELFFEDAQVAAAALDIALTTRGKHLGENIPMCGVPAHSADTYLEKLIGQGKKVAICEQTEDPAIAKKRPGKKLVARDIVRIVTPGTITEETLLKPGQHHYLAALWLEKNIAYAGWADISTGSFCCECSAKENLPALIARLSPKEILISERADLEAHGIQLSEDWGETFTKINPGCFDAKAGRERLLKHYGLASLEAFGNFSKGDLAVLGALLDYLQTTQKGLLPRLDAPGKQSNSDHLHIDHATRRNLELFQSSDGQSRNSLFSTLDHTLTNAGKRLFGDYLASPLTDRERINQRLVLIDSFLERKELCDLIRQYLRKLPDLARALSRLVLNRGGPRDVLSVGNGLAIALEIRQLLQTSDQCLQELAGCIAELSDLSQDIKSRLNDPAPVFLRDGQVIKEGASSLLDEWRQLSRTGKDKMAELEALYKERYKIPSLKIRHNNLLGYHIEIKSAHLDLVPEAFMKRQGLVNASRYKSDELNELEDKIASAGEKVAEIEQAIFKELKESVLENEKAISTTATALARLDVAAAQAFLAARENYCRPLISNDSGLYLKQCRHPIVERSLKAENKVFHPNDCRLDEGKNLWLLTGPNMAGKSTFLRQTALALIMAQAGFYVAAEEARIGIADRLFSRVGASDDLARGRSTFMVEMVETAAILHQATEKSFVILDEIGRGTATFDGLSIAWAVIEHLHNQNRSRSLFATHYHELVQLEETLTRIALYSLQVEEWKNQIVFMHQVIRGAAKGSYGINVAQLAGLPKPVLRRARQILKTIEHEYKEQGGGRELPLFQEPSESVEASNAPKGQELVEALEAIDLDELTPRQALDRLFDLKALISGKS